VHCLCSCARTDLQLSNFLAGLITATLSYFSGCHGIGKRGVEEIATAVFDAPVSLGTVANLEQEMSAALAPPHQEAVTAVRGAAVKHADETSWKLAGKQCWLWGAVHPTKAYLASWMARIFSLKNS